ncbi:hypothetical protein VTN31DRAFT_4779 [Thermomyces dupontii]|uniref:uncharacterized protein n=1 Tax=Talaromyces thermophilus TaxID=28565 RepID=UPI00374317E6
MHEQHDLTKLDAAVLHLFCISWLGQSELSNSSRGCFPAVQSCCPSSPKRPTTWRYSSLLRLSETRWYGGQFPSSLNAIEIGNEDCEPLRCFKSLDPTGQNTYDSNAGWK